MITQLSSTDNIELNLFKSDSPTIKNAAGEDLFQIYIAVTDLAPVPRILSVTKPQLIELRDKLNKFIDEV